MARKTGKAGKLSAKAAEATKAAGLHADGGGLYLQVTKAGGRSWIYRYQLAGRRRYMGLGPFPAVSLAQARERASEARRQIAEGNDPIEAGRAQALSEALAGTRALAFETAARQCVAAMAPKWRNEKHQAQWLATLERYAFPAFGKVPVAAVELHGVLRALEPIWTTKPETARRVRGRIEAVLDWAGARGLRSGENPARWGGRLKHLLPGTVKAKTLRHHPAMPFAEVPAFMARLAKLEGTAPRALAFTILTAARTSETTGATWAEFDLQAGLWTVPASRIKAGREHRVPLSVEALAIVKAMHEVRSGAFVFPGGKIGAGLSNGGMVAVLRRMGSKEGITVHGFRSAFRDWAGEATAFPREVAEAALAHVVGDKVEAAYRRGDALEKRRKLMQAWAAFCCLPVAKAGGKVVSIGKR